MAATLSGSSFSATISLSTVTGAPTPIVARVTEPDNDVALDTIRVTRFGGTLEVSNTFPDSGAALVPGTVQILVGFSHAVDASTLSGGFVLETSTGQAVAGVIRSDREVVTFAPTAPLAASGSAPFCAS